MRADQKPHLRLAPKDATKYVFAAMWTPVIMLLLGGFTIAAALSKFHIAKMMATFFLSKAGTRPRTVLVTNMFVAMILSMWISNVASPVLCFSIIQVSHGNEYARAASDGLQASPPQPSIRLQFLESSHSRNRSGVQHWRCCFPHRFSSKHHRPPKHAAPTQLGRLVLRRSPHLHPLDPSYLATPPRHLPTRKRHNDRANTANEGQIHWRAVFHQCDHRHHYSALVRHPSTRARLRRHGRRSYHPHGRLLRHRHPHERRLQ